MRRNVVHWHRLDLVFAERSFLPHLGYLGDKTTAKKVDIVAILTIRDQYFDSAIS